MPYQRILELMCPGDEPGLFVLGAYAKRVTICSQQVRAINLVDAIDRYRRALAGCEVAVVGGGIAGLTAAARALQWDARVTVFEQNADFLAVQGDASHRWVHPHIYEWPVEEPGEVLSSEAGLPVMSWQAGFAKDVASQLREQWREIAARHYGRLQQHHSTRVVAVGRSGEQYRLRWRDQRNGADAEADFSLVILAIGYGLEAAAGTQSSYWRPDGLDWIGQPGPEQILVVGYGDGALTDLMRACLTHFVHGQVLQEVRAKLGAADLNLIRELEQGAAAHSPPLLTRRYRDLDLPQVRELLQVNKQRTVVLSGKGPDLFDPRASVLNRVVVSQLLRIGAFRHIPLPQDLSVETASNDDAAVAEVRRCSGIAQFSQIILRTGPRRVLTIGKDAAAVVAQDAYGAPLIAGLPRGLAQLRDEWAGLPAAQDPTRRPLWSRLAPLWETLQPDEPQRQPLLSAADAYCLAFHCSTGGAAAPPWLVTQSALAVRRIPLPFMPLCRGLAVEDCVANEETLALTTRLLCTAPIAIFSLGQRMGQANPAGLLLLGIRAAVRRGLTLVVVDSSDGEPDWNELPFNLKDLLVLPLAKGDSKKLAAVLATGMGSLQASAQGYRDLPAFDAVRKCARRSPPIADGYKEILALCPYSKHYQSEVWPRLHELLDGLGVTNGEQFDIRPVTEYLSPLLAGERIYDLIRFAERCLVDWTEWRANVFFELGVRLAVNRLPPLCVLREGEPEDGPAAQNLLRLFAPLRYDLARERGQYDSTFCRAFLQRERELVPTGVEANPVYRMAERQAALDQEFGAEPLEDVLLGEVEAYFGPDPRASGGLSFLYWRNPALAQQVWNGCMDRLEALLAFRHANALQRRGKRLADLERRLKELGDIGVKRGYRRRGGDES